MALYEKFIGKTEFTSYEDFFVNYRINVPENFNFAYDVIDEIAKETPDKTALVWCNVAGDEKTFSFLELQKKVNQTANYFQDLGIKRGTPVMLILKRHYQFWFCILALHKLGAIAIPATHLLKRKDVEYRVSSAEAEFVVCTKDSDVPTRVLEGIADTGRDVGVIAIGDAAGCLNYNLDVEKYSTEFVRPTGELASTNEDIMLLYFTSGTTGYPKMVAHNYTYPLGHIVTARYWHHVIDGGLHLTIADTGWAKAAWGKIYGQWLCGSGIFVYDFDKFVPKDVLHMIERHKVTTLCAPPTMYRFFIQEDLTKFDLSSVTYTTIAGEPLNPEVFNQFKSLTGLELREGFGQTECTLMLGNYEWIDVKPGSMGKPSPGYNVDLVDEDGKSVNIGEVGQLVVRANMFGQVGLFNGYHKNKQKTDEAWEFGVYHTGDLAWQDEQGYYWYVGRSDDIIKSSGYRIGPFEVESALMEHPSVMECAITAVPDDIRGAVVKATIVLAKGFLPSDKLKKDLQDHVKNVTAPYKYPRIIEFVEILPKTISGKIRRVEIRDIDKNK